MLDLFHEPQKVAQASCLFGTDRLEACPTLQPAPRFMAPTHVRILEVLALHEPGGASVLGSPDFRPREIRARRSLHPPQYCDGGRVAPPFRVPMLAQSWD